MKLRRGWATQTGTSAKVGGWRAAQTRYLNRKLPSDIQDGKGTASKNQKRADSEFLLCDPSLRFCTFPEGLSTPRLSDMKTLGIFGALGQPPTRQLRERGRAGQCSPNLQAVGY